MVISKMAPKIATTKKLSKTAIVNGISKLLTAMVATYAPIIISSPWARFMIFIMPRIMISPKATKNR